MKVALVNPPWSFEGSVYFGCREPHLPLEYGFARALLSREGHEAGIFDAHLRGLHMNELREEVRGFRPDMIVVTTAPSYLFWRCAPPELRVPGDTISALRDIAGTIVVVGPHASTTPAATLKKLGADAVVLGECEEILVRLANTPRDEWQKIPSVGIWLDERPVILGGPHSTEMKELPPLRWERESIGLHRHHHHRFDIEPDAPGAEVEYARGCPYHCTFCAKDNFRDRFRKRPLGAVLAEIDDLIEKGARYVYFIDEIFVPDRPLLEALCERDIRFGVQMRIDNWTPEMLDLLGKAGCVSIEAGVESITKEGRSLLAKKCKLSTEELTALLIHAKRSVAFVQANLLEAKTDDPEDVLEWRDRLRDAGVWANEPVPLFPYPGSPSYSQRWGKPDDLAWERAHEHYLAEFDRFSDIQVPRPLPLAELENMRRHA